MIDAIGKNHGHYQIERNMAIVKKKYMKRRKGAKENSRKLKRKSVR
jgi:hypothetical protein